MLIGHEQGPRNDQTAVTWTRLLIRCYTAADHQGKDACCSFPSCGQTGSFCVLFWRELWSGIVSSAAGTAGVGDGATSCSDSSGCKCVCTWLRVPDGMQMRRSSCHQCDYHGPSEPRVTSSGQNAALGEAGLILSTSKK